jgi:hypothetical protein
VDVHHPVAEGVGSRLIEERGVQRDPAAAPADFGPDGAEDRGVDRPVEPLQGAARPEGPGGEDAAVDPAPAQEAGSEEPQQPGADARLVQEAMPEGIGVHDAGAPFPKERGHRALAAADASGKTDDEWFHRSGFFRIEGSTAWGTATTSQV